MQVNSTTHASRTSTASCATKANTGSLSTSMRYAFKGTHNPESLRIDQTAVRVYMPEEGEY